MHIVVRNGNRRYATYDLVYQSRKTNKAWQQMPEQANSITEGHGGVQQVGSGKSYRMSIIMSGSCIPRC